MASVTTKKCDITGSFTNVKSYWLRLYCDIEGEGMVAVDERRLDMCPRAKKRLIRFIDRGVSPPTKEADDAGSDQES